MTVSANWNGKTLARSDATLVVEGNHYFPAADVAGGVLVPSETTSFCPWKGTAHYYSIDAGGAINRDAAWYYPQPSERAAALEGRIAFWKGVEVVEE